MGDRPRLLLIGGAGYIGSRLTQALASHYDVVVTARHQSPVRTAWFAEQRVSSIAFDSLSGSTLPAGQFDGVLNLGSVGAVEAADDPEAALQRADRMAQLLVAGLKEGRVGKLVHFSSFQVYGPPVRAVYEEDAAPTPRHPYAVAHLHGERVLTGSGLHNLAIVRPTNIVAAPAHGDLGPQAKLIFLDLCREAIRSHAIALRNDGKSFRDFLGVDDVVAAVRVLLARTTEGPSIFNLSMGESMRLDSLAEAIRDGVSSLTGSVPTLAFGSGTDDYRAPFQVSNARLRELGWTPALSIRDEILKTLRFFQN